MGSWSGGREPGHCLHMITWGGIYLKGESEPMTTEKKNVKPNEKQKTWGKHETAGNLSRTWYLSPRSAAQHDGALMSLESRPVAVYQLLYRDSVFSIK